MNRRTRSRRAIAVAAVATIVVASGAAGVFAVSGRLSLVDRREELAEAARTDAAAHLADLPSGHRDDRELVESATLPVPDEAVLVEYVTSTATSLGLRTVELVASDDVDTLRSAAVAALGVGGEGTPLEPVATVVAVEGQVSSVAAFLDLVERGQYPLALSSVRLSPIADGVRAVVGVAGVHFRALSPSQRVALGQAAVVSGGSGS